MFPLWRGHWVLGRVTQRRGADGRGAEAARVTDRESMCPPRLQPQPAAPAARGLAPRRPRLLLVLGCLWLFAGCCCLFVVLAGRHLCLRSSLCPLAASSGLHVGAAVLGRVAGAARAATAAASLLVGLDLGLGFLGLALGGLRGGLGLSLGLAGTLLGLDLGGAGRLLLGRLGTRGLGLGGVLVAHGQQALGHALQVAVGLVEQLDGHGLRGGAGLGHDAHADERHQLVAPGVAAALRGHAGACGRQLRVGRQHRAVRLVGLALAPRRHGRGRGRRSGRHRTTLGGASGAAPHGALHPLAELLGIGLELANLLLEAAALLAGRLLGGALGLLGSLLGSLARAAVGLALGLVLALALALGLALALAALLAALVVRGLGLAVLAVAVAVLLGAAVVVRVA
mmetsp:Transcript_60805/g.168215  ORF Transcript_60805/g.168215 Transcript_60805/m.168215 type:complete len:398 (-) Transcript_60805:1065-2258(-)